SGGLTCFSLITDISLNSVCIQCLIIGAGPCGLRTAIELAFLGARVVLLEKRDAFSRNNVLHLWPLTIHDLRGLGAKKFYGKFCAGAIDHIRFRRKEFRGKLAIAITANFINRNTTAEAKVEEISGVAFIFNQKFFQDLREATDTELLLSRANVDQDALLSYACEAADFSTNHQLPTLDFAINHYGQPDVAMFDFTCMYATENAAMVRQRHGHKLLVALVGDSLLESVALCFRESIYRLLPQTTPENVSKNFSQYSVDPTTRYPNINLNFLRPSQVSIELCKNISLGPICNDVLLQVRHLFDTGEGKEIRIEIENVINSSTPKLARNGLYFISFIFLNHMTHILVSNLKPDQAECLRETNQKNSSVQHPPHLLPPIMQTTLNRFFFQEKDEFFQEKQIEVDIQK
ncbi:hypothetical protein XENOCAPTIV_001840, partial [Xenoophorus captivus]